MDDGQAPDEGTLRFLKAMVTVLTATMILGVILIVALLVMRLGESRRVTFPENLALPDGVVAEAFTQTADWYAVVTAGQEILIYSRATGKLTQRIALTSAE